MILSIPFLASDARQFDPGWVDRGCGVEASLFDRADLDDPRVWDGVRATVRGIARDVRPRAFTFHFPVNDCDYVAEPAVRRRLLQAIDLVAECGLDGLVLHTNRTRTVEWWRRADLAAEADRFATYIDGIRELIAGAPFWVGLENVPVVGNDAADADPLLVYASDAARWAGGNVGVTLDYCHYSYSTHVASRCASGLADATELYVRTVDEGPLGFLPVLPLTVHHHFSAFRGLATRAGGRCVEGVPPWAGTLPESVYEQAFRAIAASGARVTTLEIREEDYLARRSVFEVIRWCERILADLGQP